VVENVRESCFGGDNEVDDRDDEVENGDGRSAGACAQGLTDWKLMMRSFGRLVRAWAARPESAKESPAVNSVDRGD
jgi:hypothetical protein